MVRRAGLFLLLLGCTAGLAAQTYGPTRHVVSEALFNAVAAEYSGAIAKENVRGIIEFHRIQASPGYSQARAWVVERLKAMGIDDVEVETFPSDGKIRYETYISPMAWAVREGELWVESPVRVRLCRYSQVPTCLTTLSNGGEWTGELVLAGSGLSDADYQDADVKGKFVMATGYAANVHRQAVLKRGAAGVLIYPPADDRPEHPDLIRYNGLWPHWDERDRVGFGFQLSRRQAEWLAALAARGPVRLRAKVDAELQPGQLEVTSAVFRGSEEPKKEIILVAHLDHPKWSANDNASGSGALLEVARTLKALTDSGQVKLRRTIRLLWVPEYNGTVAWVSKHRDIGQRAIAALNLDMVGEDLHKTNSVLRITRTPESLPSFLNDLVEDAAAQVAEAGLVEPTGTQNLFHYKLTPDDMGSDHDVFNDSTVGVPAMMFGHWPDWTHHTSEDTLDKVDPTTLKRVGVLATATAVWLASADDYEALELAKHVARNASAVRGRVLMGRLTQRNVPEEVWAARTNRAVETLLSVTVLMTPQGNTARWVSHYAEPLQEKRVGYARRVPRGKELVPRRLFVGPLADDYSSTWFREQLGADYDWWEEQKAWAKWSHSDVGNFWDLLVYETLNFTDGERSLAKVEEVVEVEFGTIPDGVVEHILRDLEKVKLVEFSEPKPE